MVSLHIRDHGFRDHWRTAFVVFSLLSANTLTDPRLSQAAENPFATDAVAQAAPAKDASEAVNPAADSVPPKCVPNGLAPTFDPNSMNSSGTNPRIPPELLNGSGAQANSLSSLGSLPAGQGALAGSDNLAFAPGFIGNFFSSGGNTTATFNSGFVTASSLTARSPDYVYLAPNGGVPDHWQTTDKYLVRTGFNSYDQTTGANGQVLLTNLHLGKPIAGQDVVYNAPETGSPNPNATIYSATTGPIVASSDPSLTGGRSQLAENTSPLPRDRVFFNYSYFDGARIGAGGSNVDVNRITPGFEKTFFNGWSSIEVRAPFASTLSSNLSIDSSTSGISNNTNVQWANLTMYGKTILYRDESLAITGGMGLTLPTARNINFIDSFSGTTLRQVRNDSVHLLPFLGTVYTPNNRLFGQSVLQFDFDTNGNRVLDNTFDGANTMRQIGRYQESSFLYFALGGGYWLFKDQRQAGHFGLTGVAPTAELHYTRSLQHGDMISNFGSTYGQSFTNVEVLDMVLGTNFLFGENRILTAGFATPLGMGADKQFNGEFRLMANWFFGRSSFASPQNRVQF